MDSKDKMITDISLVIAGLSHKLETLQAKVEELCRATGGCKQVKKVNKELIPNKGGNLGTNIDPLREEK
mgnify:FL=1